MTNRKVTAHVVTTQEIDAQTSAPMPDTGRPYVLESAEFDAFVFSKRKTAQREVDELDLEISRLQTEIEARLARKQDLLKIVYKCEAILSMKDATPAPQLVENANG